MRISVVLLCLSVIYGVDTSWAQNLPNTVQRKHQITFVEGGQFSRAFVPSTAATFQTGGEILFGLEYGYQFDPRWQVEAGANYGMLGGTVTFGVFEEEFTIPVFYDYVQFPVKFRYTLYQGKVLQMTGFGMWAPILFNRKFEFDMMGLGIGFSMALSDGFYIRADGLLQSWRSNLHDGRAWNPGGRFGFQYRFNNLKRPRIIKLRKG